MRRSLTECIGWIEQWRMSSIVHNSNHPPSLYSLQNYINEITESKGAITLAVFKIFPKK